MIRAEISTEIVYALGERPRFAPGASVRVASRSPIGHYRVPTYLRGLGAIVEAVIEPVAVDNEAEGFGRDAGMKRHYYRIVVPLTAVWSVYAGSQRDTLHIEVFDSWLEEV